MEIRFDSKQPNESNECSSNTSERLRTGQKYHIRKIKSISITIFF